MQRLAFKSNNPGSYLVEKGREWWSQRLSWMVKQAELPREFAGIFSKCRLPGLIPRDSESPSLWRMSGLSIYNFPRRLQSSVRLGNHWPRSRKWVREGEEGAPGQREVGRGCEAQSDLVRPSAQAKSEPVTPIASVCHFSLHFTFKDAPLVQNWIIGVYWLVCHLTH